MPRFFATPARWRKWLERNHDRESVLWVGFYKVGSGRRSITWPLSVDEALCFGWIDGLRRRIDDEAYKIRFSPRKRTSTWSRVNVARMAELEAEGRVLPPGRAAFQRRKEARTGRYGYEQSRPSAFPSAFARRLEANSKARTFFRSKAPGYQKACLHWVMSAKRSETRERRFALLLEDCAAGRTIKPLTSRPRSATAAGGGSRHGG